MFLTKMKMAFSDGSLILLRMTYTNCPTLRSAGTRYLDSENRISQSDQHEIQLGGELARTHFFLSMSGMSLRGAFSTITCRQDRGEPDLSPHSIALAANHGKNVVPEFCPQTSLECAGPHTVVLLQEHVRMSARYVYLGQQTSHIYRRTECMFLFEGFARCLSHIAYETLGMIGVACASQG